MTRRRIVYKASIAVDSESETPVERDLVVIASPQVTEEIAEG
jgi:hypothetical protein